MKQVLFAVSFAMVPMAASALDIEAMTEAERAAFQAEVRAYLLENPEVIMEAVQVLEERRNLAEQAAEEQMLSDNRAAIFDDGFSYVGGNPDGDVTIVEFMDYRCGFCKRSFPEVEELIASDGNIRFVLKEFPILGDASVLASRYAIAVKMVEDDDAYKAVHDDLMTLRTDVTDAALRRLSDKHGLDHDAVAEQMQDESVTAIIEENRALATRLDIQGTPAFIMGEEFVRGYVSLDQMRAIVEAIRAEQS